MVGVIYIIMTLNKTPTNNILDLSCLKSIVSHDVDEIILPDCLSPDFLLIFNMLDLYDFNVTNMHSIKKALCL